MRVMDDWQSKGSGFPGTGVGHPNQVLIRLHQVIDSFMLDRSGTYKVYSLKRSK
jgi:hypothetical protein